MKRNLLFNFVLALCLGAVAHVAQPVVELNGEMNSAIAGEKTQKAQMRQLDNPEASPEARELFETLQRIHAAGKTLAGQMWSPWEIDEVESVYQVTGKYPAVRGHDLITEKNNAVEVEKMIDWYRRGGIVTLMWHWGAPTLGEGYEQSKGTIDVNKCFEEGTPENKAMWDDLNRVAGWLTKLRDAHVPVLWRPMHEFDGKWFWYGKGGGELFNRLWKTMYTYFTQEKKLNNLIWVLPHSGNIDETFKVDSKYFDIAGPDTYNNSTLKNLYQTVKTMYPENDLIPLHECGTLPDPEMCQREGMGWMWWMLWHTSFVSRHNREDMRRIYNHDLIITLDEVGQFESKERRRSVRAYQRIPMPITVSQNDLKQGFSIEPGENQWLFSSQKKVLLDFVAINNAKQADTDTYTLTLSTDKHELLKTFSKRVKLNGGEKKKAVFDLGKLKPGFYTLKLTKKGGADKTFNIGVDPEQVISVPDAQPDFKEFWDRARAELAAIAPDYKMEEMKDKSNDRGTVYKVTMNSLGGHRLQCYLSVPKRPGRYPIFITYNGYSSTAFVPSPNPRYCELNVSTRGQGTIENNIYGDWIRWNIDNPEKYYYRGAFMDCVRAIDFAAQCEWVDPTRMFAEGGSQGGAFTLAAASLDDRLCAIAPDVPFLNDYPDYFKIVDWPASAVFAAQKAANLSDEQLYRNLSYFDIKNLTPWIKCPVIMGFGLQDVTCPPHTNFAGFNNIPHKNKTWRCYPLSGHALWQVPEWSRERTQWFQQFMRRRNNGGN